MKNYVTVSLLVSLLMVTIPIYLASATSTTIVVDPPTSYVTAGASFSININVTNVVGLTSWQFKFYFLNSVVNCTGVTEGPFLKSVGGTFFNKTITNNYNDTYGRLLAYCTLLGDVSVSGDGVLATVNFKALSVGDSSLHLSETKLGDTNIPPQPIDHVDIDGTVHVQSFTLTVTVSPDGSGSVNLNESGPYYHYGETVQLTANPTIGWSFDHWGGDLSGSTSPSNILIDGDKSVTATFTQNAYTLTITPVGSGSVTTNQSAPYHYGDVVQLNATATIGWTFDHWSVDLDGSTNPTTITIDGNKAVTATFTQNVYTLTITPVGSGSVTTNQSAPYHYGDVVQLNATATADWSFQYWTGDLSGSANVTTITMTADHFVTAHFIDKPTLQMSPASKTCRIYHENFAVTITVSNAANVEGFAFEIDYNTTLLDYVSVTWGIWGSTHATITPDEANGKITVSNSGTAISGTQTLVTISFTVSLHSILVWNGTDWTGNFTDRIYFQSISMSYPTGPALAYQRGDSTQIGVGPDFTYTFLPIRGDINNDGTVDVFDLRTVAAYYDISRGDPLWSAASAYDLNMDGTVDVADIYIVTSNYDFTYVP